MKLRIGILGTRGIPNHYGGFEYFAEHLSQQLVKKGHEVFVYASHNHPNQQPVWNQVHIIHCYDPEYRLGTAGQFLYDLNCLLDARKRNYDILLLLGYTSSAIWGFLYPRDTVIISNMDGLEWKRSKYKPAVQNFLRLAERLAVRHSHYLVADSTFIQAYLQEKYEVHPTYIAYGASVFTQPNHAVLHHYQLTPYRYNMLMARMEPENNIEMILDGYHAARSPLDFVVVGNTGNPFGHYLRQKFAADRRIRFAGAIYDQHHINNLIYFSNLYFHGHSVGGTNPSLLEAMGSEALIVAQDNVFNRAVLQEHGYYFTTPHEIKQYADRLSKNEQTTLLTTANKLKIEQLYSWNRIVDAYESFFIRCVQEKYQALSIPTILSFTK